MAVQRLQLPIEGDYCLNRTLSVLTMGRGNPCLRHSPTAAQLTVATPDGPVAVAAQRQQIDSLRVTIDGPGADWVTPHLPALFGLRDDAAAFDPGPGALRRIVQAEAGVRLVRWPIVYQRLVQVVLQQLIAFRDACRAWRLLVTRYGEEAPGSGGLYHAPTAEQIANLAVYQLMECEVLPRHARVILAMAKQAAGLERLWDAAGGKPDAANDDPACEVARDRVGEFLIAQPGVGPWTVGYLRGAGLGDADAAVLGDYGHPHHVAYFFTGKERSDDEEMLRLLEPYRPHRFRVLQLLIAGAPAPPRRGPRRRRLGERFR